MFQMHTSVQKFGASEVKKNKQIKKLYYVMLIKKQNIILY